MQKLNLRTPKIYDYSSESETMQPRIRFYCVAEGATEESYFRGIRNNRGSLGIKNDVLITVVPKEEGQENLSHPMQLVKACLVAMGCMDTNDREIPREKRRECCAWEGYEPEQDVVCVIFDRDYRKLDQCMDEIFSLCRKYKIRIIMSNPNFELWLLMHFPGIDKYNREMLFENRKNLRQEIVPGASTKKKYLEIQVANQCPGYKKGNSIKFEHFQSGVELAVKQAKLFCEEPEMLQTELGTAVGKLIQDMKK